MKEKFVELMMDKPFGNSTYEAEEKHIEDVADYLIANGACIRGTGYWEWDTEDIYQCSNCGAKVHVEEVMEQPVWEYCPVCGDNMKWRGCR